MGYNGLDPISKANMSIVNKLLNKIPDWKDIILSRRVKFVESYFKNNKDLKKVGEEFGFTEEDMKSIFWRIQKQLQNEYNKRIEQGLLEKPIVVIVQK